ncbi:MAG TPA: hypothetical protein VFQ39_00190, partial [Longimicrobium sp.]|nr:hypothetical protein [Longimicrobium sp.]
MRAPFLAALVLLAGASAAPALVPRAAVPERAPGKTLVAPVVTITPASGSYSGTAGTLALDVIIEWCGSDPLDGPSRTIVLDNTTNVKAGFSYTTGSKAGCASYAVSRDTLLLAPGSHTLQAGIWDDPAVGEP